LKEASFHLRGEGGKRAEKKAPAYLHIFTTEVFQLWGTVTKSHTNKITGEHLFCIIPAKQESHNRFEGFILLGMFAFLQGPLKCFSVSVCKHETIQERLKRL
jgi:hypothetical protein